MLKPLLKKQLTELVSFLFINRKNGKARSKIYALYMGLLFLLLFACVAYMFFAMADTLCTSLVYSGLQWLYFALFGLVATAFGIFGSVFTFYSGVFDAKDNDLLFSMPINQKAVVFARIVGVYISAFLFEALILIPAVVVYASYFGLDLGLIVFAVMAVLLLPFVALTVSSILGFLLAVVLSKTAKKETISTVISLVFLVCYYYVYFNAQKYLAYIVDRPEKVGAVFKTALFPFYRMGLASEGDVVSALLFCAVTILPMVLVYDIISKKYVSLAITKPGQKKKSFVYKDAKIRSPFSALFGKELKRFSSSSVYMLNCGLGTLLMPVIAVAAIVKGKELAELLPIAYPGFDGDFFGLLACGFLGFSASLNSLTSPSISLEGSYISQLKSLPVRGFDVLKAKICLHLLFTVPPALMLAAAFIYMLSPSWIIALAILVVAVIYPVFGACLGLIINLKLPNFSWTSETVAVKQSASVIFSTLGSYVPIFVAGGVYAGVHSSIAPAPYLGCAIALLAALCTASLLWLKCKADKLLLDL